MIKIFGYGQDGPTIRIPARASFLFIHDMDISRLLDAAHLVAA
jgi:hypothetical protein